MISALPTSTIKNSNPLSDHILLSIYLSHSSKIYSRFIVSLPFSTLPGHHPHPAFIFFLSVLDFIFTNSTFHCSLISNVFSPCPVTNYAFANSNLGLPYHSCSLLYSLDTIAEECWGNKETKQSISIYII